MCARQVLQDSGEDLSISKRPRELIFSKPTLFACILKFVLNVRGDIGRERVRKFISKLEGVKLLIEGELRVLTGMQDIPIVKLMDQITLERWVTEPQLRKDGLP
jgi:hypothetical protein